MHAMLLRFIGSFSQLQDLIDDVVIKTFFTSHMPAAGEVFWKRTVDRIKDEERVKFLLAIAAEIGSDAELDSFKAVFNRVKEFRNIVAHSAKIVEDGEDRLVILRTVFYSAIKPQPAPAEVDRSQLSQAIRDCDWLTAQTHYIQSSMQKEIQMEGFPSSGSKPSPALMKAVKPSREPEDWNGVVFQGVDVNVIVDTS